MRVIVIGAGGAGRVHCPVLHKLGQEVYVSDCNPEAQRAAALDFGVAEHADWSSGDFDMAVVAVPPPDHYDVVRANAEMGRIVVCEKPLCLRPEDAMALTREVDEKGWRVYIAESQGYYGPDGMGLAEMKRRIEDNDFGNPVRWWLRGMTTWRPQQWVSRLDVGGGCFVEGGIHPMTVAKYLFGTSVNWQGSFVAENGRAPHTGTMIVDYELGHGFVLQMGWGTEGCFNGICKPLTAVTGLVGTKWQEVFWPQDDHETMWQTLLGFIERDEPPLITLDCATAALMDVWRCYAAGGIGLPEED